MREKLVKIFIILFGSLVLLDAELWVVGVLHHVRGVLRGLGFSVVDHSSRGVGSLPLSPPVEDGSGQDGCEEQDDHHHGHGGPGSTAGGRHTRVVIHPRDGGGRNSLLIAGLLLH